MSLPTYFNCSLAFLSSFCKVQNLVIVDIKFLSVVDRCWGCYHARIRFTILYIHYRGLAIARIVIPLCVVGGEGVLAGEYIYKQNIVS